jgi:hypothetical protein
MSEQPPKPTDPAGHPHPPDWSASDSVLESEIRDEMRRIARDEQRLAADERKIRIDWWMALGALILAGLAITALVLGVIALNRDIEAVAKAGPKENSVGTSAIQNGAVTAPKLAAGAVGTAALRPKGVTAAKVADNSLTGAQINESTLGQVPTADNSLTGAQINESTLGQVPTAANALKLGGIAPAAFVSGVKIVQAATDQTSAALKGPTVATCPSGSRVVGGGAEVQGASNVALSESAPSGTSAWTAIAGSQGGSTPSWKLIVYAICATGGS